MGVVAIRRVGVGGRVILRVVARDRVILLVVSQVAASRQTVYGVGDSGLET